MKPSLLYYSDCPFFAGCENMLANFFNSPTLHEKYDILFVYRYSPEYELGLNKRLIRSIEKKPVRVYDHFDLYNLADSIRGKIFRKPLKVLFNLILIKYFYLFVNTISFTKLLRKTPVDVLHINNGGYPAAYSTIAMVFAARICGVRRIVYVTNNLPQGYVSPERWLDYILDKLVIRWVAVFVTCSHYAGCQVVKTLGVPQHKVNPIHNGIAARPITETREEVMQRLNLCKDRLICSVVALLEERKGQIYLLQALKQFKDRYGVYNMPFCILVGTGPDKCTLEQYVSDNGLEHDILFISHEMEIFNIINMSDFIVLPSIKNEDLPNVILESMSLSKPVIASEFSGIPEQIEHMKSGILVKPKDVSGLMEAIKLLSDSKELRMTLGKNAKMRFETQYTDEIAIMSYDKLYTRFLSEMPS